MNKQHLRLALIADWLPTFGGAEHVIAEFHCLWPEAPLFTTIANHGHIGPLDRANIHTSRLQYAYNLLHTHRLLLPWMPQTMENIDLRHFDVVLSSSHAIGKGVIPPPTAVHICYCHTPMRYAWEMEAQYLQDFHIPKILKGTVQKHLRRLRRWDLTSAQRVDHFIANSSTVQQRIERTYGRKSTVVHPPVSQRFFDTPLHSSVRKEYFLALGRLVPYKRFDLLVETANMLSLPLKVAGSGQDAQRLQRMAGPSVEMLGYVPDEDLPALYQGAKALLFPQLEDAGVTPLEAQACGTPVIALGKGGALDTVVNGKTGLFFEEQTVASLQSALRKFEGMQFDVKAIRSHAKAFSSDRFRSKIVSIVDEAVEAQEKRKRVGFFSNEFAVSQAFPNG
ncbi:MAG: Glycosyl transferase group 1 [Candidatus Peribacteria bacterium GW2011_GWC2_54_8]|nr:MAG: Glycosyl transferase group 1 [Candidatus Peribacteria bacterium GW2011_GWC2_54_8]